MARSRPQDPPAANGPTQSPVTPDGGRLPESENVRTWLYRSDRAPGPADVQDWPQLCRDDENLLWVDLTDPSDALITEVAQLLGIEHLGLAASHGPVPPTPRTQVCNNCV